MTERIPWITIITLLPLAGGLVVACLPERRSVVWGVGRSVSVIVLLIAAGLWAGFDPQSGAAMQFEERHAWIPSVGAEYVVGLDGMSLMLVLLTAFLFPFALMLSGPITHGARGYVAWVLCLESGLLGAFTALNFFHWFLFWELSLVPAYFLIKLWGGAGRVEAATQFFVYTMVGSVALLIAFVALFLAGGTFDFGRLSELARSGDLMRGIESRFGMDGRGGGAVGNIIFAAAFLGFAVKLPIVPFHTWLPAAYVAAPTPVTILLTGAMSKLGMYGILRILAPIFSDQMRSLMVPLLWLGVATVVWPALAALAQRDMKRMLAYSSVNHLGYCALGTFAAVGAGEGGASGAVDHAFVMSGVLLQMFNHGIIAAALFALVGFVEERRGGRHGLDELGGLGKAAPVMFGVVGIAVFASLGLPGLSGFVGEFLIFRGLFALAPWAAVLALAGLLATAWFLLDFLQRVFTGPANPKLGEFCEMTWRERALILPSIALILILGICPAVVLDRARPAVKTMLAWLGASG